MKKLIGLCFSLCLMSFVAISQETITTESSNTATEQAYDAQVSAKKASCKKVCTASKASTGNVKSALVSIDGEQNSSAGKKCDVKACAKKMGISEAECRKKCDSSMAKAGNNETDTQVASAVMENDGDVVEAGVAKKACSKTCKKTCKK